LRANGGISPEPDEWPRRVRFLQEVRGGASMRADTGQVGTLIGAIFAGSPDAIVVVDSSGRIVLSSSAVTTVFGYYPEELVGEPVEVLLPAESRQIHPTHRRRFTTSGRARQMGSGIQLMGLTRDGRRVPIDVSLTPVMVSDERYVAAFVRDASARRRTIEQVEAANDLTRRLLAGSALEEVLPLVTVKARALMAAAAAWLVMPSPDGPLVVNAADGPGTDILLGVQLSEVTSRSAQVMQRGEVDLVADLSLASNVPKAAAVLGLGPGLYVPISSAAGCVGTLVVARAAGSPGFDDFEVALAESYAGAAAVAMALGAARGAFDRLRLQEEDDRIARDLHDKVIQRAFAIGMSLEAVRGMAPPVVEARLVAAVDGLDEMIGELRNSIFRLSQPAGSDQGLRGRLFALIDRVTQQLGFSPRVAVRGALEVAVSTKVAEELLTVCAEALSNVARHSSAQNVQVVVAVEEGWVVLTVTDDGVGPGPDGVERSAGNGLRNMTDRATQLGGRCLVTSVEPHGTAVDWRVPAAV